MATEEERLQDLTSEILFIGTMYKYPGIVQKYRRYLGDEDFSTPASRFFHTLFEKVYDTYSKTPDEVSIAGFLTGKQKILEKFNEYGGFTTIQGFMDACNSNDVDKYFDNIKKYSLLRTYHSRGFPVMDLLNGAVNSKTREVTKFEDIKAKHILRILINRISKIYTNLKNTEDMQDLY